MHNNDGAEDDVEITTHKKRYVAPEERQQIIDELRSVIKSMHIFKKLHIFPEERQQVIDKLKSA